MLRNDISLYRAPIGEERAARHMQRCDFLFAPPRNFSDAHDGLVRLPPPLLGSAELKRRRSRPGLPPPTPADKFLLMYLLTPRLFLVPMPPARKLIRFTFILMLAQAQNHFTFITIYHRRRRAFRRMRRARHGRAARRDGLSRRTMLLGAARLIRR